MFNKDYGIILYIKKVQFDFFLVSVLCVEGERDRDSKLIEKSALKNVNAIGYYYFCCRFQPIYGQK